jgi:hypothetical protein
MILGFGEINATLCGKFNLTNKGNPYGYSFILG